MLVKRREGCRCVPAGVGLVFGQAGGFGASSSGFLTNSAVVSLAAGGSSLLRLRVLQASQGQLHEERLFSEGERWNQIACYSWLVRSCKKAPIRSSKPAPLPTWHPQCFCRKQQRSRPMGMWGKCNSKQTGKRLPWCVHHMSSDLLSESWGIQTFASGRAPVRQPARGYSSVLHPVLVRP